jgi:archaellum component FlaC
MTIDERLERLTERHEALTQTVEHLARQGEEQNGRLAQLAISVDRIVGVVEGLATIVASHERRLSGLEGV